MSADCSFCSHSISPRAARQRFVARGVHGHAARAFLLRDVAGRIRGGEQLLDRACFAADLDEADRHADVEHAVVPDEAIRGDRAAHVVGDLPRLVERAADQQHAELVAAEARDRVRVAHRFAQQLRDFAQHAVAGEMAAGVVDDLEAIEIEVTQHVRGVATPRGFDRFVEAALELAPVHEAGERIVRRLVRHLPMQAAQLGDVVQQDDRASELAALIAQRRCGELDGALLPRGLAEQHGPAAQIVRIAVAAADRFLDRIGELLAIVLVDQPDDFLEQPADGLRARARRAASRRPGSGTRGALRCRW